MEKIFEKIWQLAFPYQDKRNDEGHAETVLNYATELIKLENANEDVVIPAAILHDIGWSQLAEEERKLPLVDERETRLRHEKQSVDLAKQILEKVNYPVELRNEIIEIISQHDTRKGFISKNEGVMRDADKLYRVSKKGFQNDARRFNSAPKKWLEKVKKDFSQDNFLYSKSARKIAENELEKRRQEFKIENGN